MSLDSEDQAVDRENIDEIETASEIIEAIKVENEKIEFLEPKVDPSPPSKVSKCDLGHVMPQAFVFSFTVHSPYKI